MTAGEDFVRKIRPLGCVLFLALSVLVAVLCLTAGTDPIPGYAPPEDMAFYKEDPAALCTELREHVLPHLEGVRDCRVLPEGGGVEIVIANADYAVTRAAVLRYFEQELLVFSREDPE